MPLTFIVRHRGSWLAWALACVMATALWAPGARAASLHIVDQAYVRDPAGQMTFDEAQRQVQTPYRGTFADPFGPRVVWIRLRVEPDGVEARLTAATTGPATAQLRVIPMWMHELTLYDPLQPDAGGYTARPDTAPATTRFSVRSLPIPVGTAPRDLWLRLESAGPSFAAVEMLAVDAAAARAESDALFQGAVIGALALLVMVGVIAWMTDRSGIGHTMFSKQVLNLTVALLNADFFLSTGGASGLPLPWISSDSGAEFMELLRLLNLAVSLWFFTRVLTVLQAPRWALLLQRVPLALMGLTVIPLLAGQLALARTLGLALYLVVPVGLVLAAFACRREPLDPARRFGLSRRGLERLAFGLVLVIAWGASFATGFHKTRPESFFGLTFPIAGISAVGVLLVVTWRRIRVDGRQRMEKQRQSELNALALEFERGERERQQAFMVMLTHELKAPLTTLGLVMSAPVASASMLGHAEIALASMRRVIDHCAQSVEFEDAATPLNRTACSLAVEFELRRDALSERDRIQLESVPELPPITVDQRMLAVIINNLLENALRYSPHASQINVSLSRTAHPQACVQQIRVSNQPAPGPLPEASRLFQKYYRGEAAQRTSGSGLGLHLSRLLARRMGGDLSYRGDARSITFTLVLPE